MASGLARPDQFTILHAAGHNSDWTTAPYLVLWRPDGKTPFDSQLEALSKHGRRSGGYGPRAMTSI
jgi:hypothetical protein